VLAPVAAGEIQDPSDIAVGIWILGVVFPWLFGRAAARQGQLLAELQATQREPAPQALLVERRRIARDVHDLRGAWAGCRDAPGHERAPRVAS
jgi:signal transduction histidine kinase